MMLLSVDKHMSDDWHVETLNHLMSILSNTLLVIISYIDLIV